MEAENNRDIAKSVFIDVLEKLAFMFGDAVPKDEIPEPSSDCTEAYMTFKGPRSGTLGIVVPTDVCSEIAANVLGMDIDDEIVIGHAEDALKEVLNVICGNLLTALEGDNPIFDLAVPLIKNISVPEWNSILESADSIAFILDESPVLMYLRSND